MKIESKLTSVLVFAGILFCLEKGTRCPGAKARIINFYYHSYINKEFGIEIIIPASVTKSIFNKSFVLSF